MRRDREVSDDRVALVDHNECSSSLARCVSCV
jgi:hypothetical protein